MGSTLDILKRLLANEVECVLVGGMAGTAHGSSIVTEDLDVCIALSPMNVSRILYAIRDLKPRWRMLPGQPSVPLDASKLATYRNLYVLTEWGQVDFLGELTGLGEFDAVRKRSVEMHVGGMPCRVLSIEALIDAKRALGRAKDLQAAHELEAIRGRRD